MTKSRQHGPALFDLLGDSQNDANDALRPSQSASPSAPADSKTSHRPESGQAIVPSRKTTTERPQVAGEASESGTETVRRRRRRLLEFDDAYVTISLTSVTAAVVVFLFAVGLLALYELGRTRGQSAGFKNGYRAGRVSYEADATSEIEAARNAPPESHVVQGLLESTGASEADNGLETSPSGPWVQGLTYIVAQEFAPHAEQDALKAQAFLRSQGIDTALIRQDNGWFQLVTTQGYDRSDTVQRNLADTFLTKEHEAGAAYYASGGGYRLEGYFKTLRDERW